MSPGQSRHVIRFLLLLLVPLFLTGLARRNGFEASALLLRFLIDNDKLPFVGQLVPWADVRYQH